MNFRMMMSAFILCGVTAALAAPPALAAPDVRYLGQRLLDLVQPDPRVSPLPTALAKELKECKFKKDEDSNQTISEKCLVRNLAPTYKQRPREEIRITADTPRCCLGAVSIDTYQSTFDETLRLFDGIPDVKKTPVNCENFEAEFGTRELFIVSKDGVNKFVIQEETDGGSGGSQTATTIFYGKPTLDCKYLQAWDERRWDLIRKANSKRADVERKALAESSSSSSNTPSSSQDKNVLTDPKTGVVLRKDTKHWSEGACIGILSVRLDSGELTSDQTTEKQNVWIRSRGKKGADLMSKFKAAERGTSVFDMLKKGRFTQADAEFLAALLEYRANFAQSDRSSRALVQMSVCGDAGFSPRL